MCGEKHNRSYQQGLERGSPPRMRGKEQRFSYTQLQARITPAYAGKRRRSRQFSSRAEDHPRMCGEKSASIVQENCQLGSPPHVRGKEPFCFACCRCPGITPACAGKRLKRSRSTVPPVAIVPLFPSVCNKPVVSDGSPAGRDAPLFLPAENAVPASPAYNLRSL